jgi:hypothetical protein
MESKNYSLDRGDNDKGCAKLIYTVYWPLCECL